MSLVAPLLLAVLVAACDSPAEPDEVSLDRVFDLRAGEAAVVAPDGLRITFREVRGDSRCPVDVVCVWEGDAEVLLQVETTPEDREEISLHTSGNFATSAAVLGHLIELKGLQPGNKAGVPTDPRAYVATLFVSRLQR